MHWLLDLALAFLALGLVEAVVKPLARRVVQRRILAAAPLLFRQLDPLLPALLQRCSGAELEEVGRQQHRRELGQRKLGAAVCPVRSAGGGGSRRGSDER